MDEWLEVVLPVGTFVLGALMATWHVHSADYRAQRQQQIEALSKVVPPPPAVSARSDEAAVAVFAFDRANLVALQSGLLDLHQAVLARLGPSGAETRTATVLDDLRLLNQVRMLASRTTDEESRRAAIRYAQQAEATLTAPGHDAGATLVAFQRAYRKATTAIGEALTGRLHQL